MGKVFNRKKKISVKPVSKDKVIALISKLHPYKLNKDLIRIGPEGDGGYLVPDDLEGIKACFSPGVDKISEFELECLNRGMDIYLADKSVDKPNLDISPDRYNFLKKYIGCTNNEEFITLDEWVNMGNSVNQEDLLLQMDIEGWEYYSLINVSDSLMKRFRIILIEFHALHNVWLEPFYKTAEVVFDKLLQTHSCVHIHPNNCCGIVNREGVGIPKVAEFTFYRNDRARFDIYQDAFPHKLDFDNNPKETIVLPKDWYRGI
ncbi:MAG: hypothetical protein JXB49_27980 [Bacteroidales bacterium]|nr:hypothetical protein [Bacteroidales bacterium]